MCGFYQAFFCDCLISRVSLSAIHLIYDCSLNLIKLLVLLLFPIGFTSFSRQSHDFLSHPKTRCKAAGNKAADFPSQPYTAKAIDPLCVCVLIWVRLWDPMDCSLPDSSVHGILQAKILKWVAISSSSGSSWPRGHNTVSCVSCIDLQILYDWTTWANILYWKAAVGATLGEKASVIIWNCNIFFKFLMSLWFP